ncbi:MAG: toll/interleukin-1 receptor domain-containing protein [archaeon]|nr:toll/interleukin-1 receptor domain-containing protein [archaeon]
MSIKSTNHIGKGTFFLSYVREDSSIVKTLFNKLQSSNFNVWFDKTSLLGGQKWSNEIEKEIKNSKAFIVCISKSSNKKSGFYQREINYALECAKEKPNGVIYIIPLLLDKCALPAHLKELHSIDYYESNGLKNLVRTLNSLNNNEQSSHQMELINPNAQKVKLNHRCNNGNAPWSDTNGSQIAVRLSPVNYPTILEKIKVYITSDDAPWTPFKINIYSPNNQHPGNRLNSIDIVDHDGNGNKWHDIDITEHKIIISEGDFFVSMEWLEAPGLNGENEVQYVYASSNKDMPGKTFFKYGTQDKWWRINDLTCWIHAIDSLGTEITP